jgi:enoyl-CoA hydratase/carnithine racemase
MSLVVASVGTAAAKDLFFTARRIDADEAARLGAIQRLVDDGDLEATTASVAHAIAENAPLTIQAAKAAIQASAGLGLPDGADPTALAEACFDSRDYQEGIRAFMEKRPPRFGGF